MSEQEENPNSGARMEKVILNYLEMETSYALLINGRRGIGKTFFIKNQLSPKICTVKVCNDNRKSYRSVYISLYGLKTIDEIYTLLAIELMPWLKEKNVKIGLSIGKLLIRGLLNISKAGDVDSYLKDVSTTAKQAVDTKDFVLIFDDLDRISPSLQIGEVVGFINSLVEHENNKVIVVADEEHLKNNTTYIAVREKTIGTVIEYSATFNYNFDAIIKIKYHGTYQSYYDYLVILKPDILSLFEQTDTQNLRTLIYFLQHFHLVFSSIHYDIGLANTDQTGLGYKKLRTLLHFTIAITIEFKNGAVNYRKKNGLDDMTAINEYLQAAQLMEMYGGYQRSMSGQQTQQLPLNYSQTFLERYYKEGNYEFYPAVYNFITGGDALDVPSVLKQLKANFDDRIYILTPQEKVYQQLTAPHVLDLSNEEYIRLSDQMLNFALEAQYSLNHYVSVLHYLSRFPEINSYDIAKTSEKLIKAVKLKRNLFAYDGNLLSELGIEESRKNYHDFLCLFRAIHEVNTSIHARMIEKVREDILKDFIEEPEKFYDNVQHYYSHDQAILAHWNFNVFYNHFKKMPVSELPRFYRFLHIRFGQVLIKDKLEYYFIEQFFNHIQKKKLNTKVSFRTIELDRIGDLLYDILTRNIKFKLAEEKTKKNEEK
jgi:hypothetical protein